MEDRYQNLLNSSSVGNLAIVSTDDLRDLQEDGVLTIQLPGNSDTLIAEAGLVDENDNVGFRWSGSLINAPGYVSFDIRDGLTGGYLMVGSDFYELIPADSVYQFLVKHSMSTDKNCGIGEDVEFELPPDITIDPQDQCDYEPDYEDCPALISVLVIVTPEAEDELADSWGGIDFFVRFGEAMTNQAFYNSDIPNKEVRVVHISKNGFDYSTEPDEDQAIFDDLGTFASWSASDRDNYNADLVVLLVGSDTYISYGGAATLPGAPSKESSFAIVEVGWYLQQGAFCHEIGHLFGCRHNWTANTGNDDEEVCAHARRNTVLIDPPFADYDIYSWRTLIGVPKEDGPIWVEIDKVGLQEYQWHESWILHYSNPEVSYQGTPTGKDAGLISDNAQQIRNSACGVADHYPQQDLSVFVAYNNPVGCTDRTFTATIVPPESGLSGVAPYTVTWYWNTTGVFNHSGQSSSLLGTGTSITVADPDACPFYFVKCVVLSSDFVQVSRIIKVKVNPACCEEETEGGGGHGRPGLLGSNTVKNKNTRLYPNPSSNRVIYLEQGEDPVISFELIDQHSRILFFDIIHTGDGDNATINLPKALPAGVYFLRLHKVTGMVESHKMFIVKS